jgi:hypothetical protein
VPSLAQDNCFQLAQNGVRPGAWETIKDYFASLSPRIEAPRSRLIQLRAQIVEVESLKQNIIEIVEAHIAGLASGGGVSKDLQSSKIGDAMKQIDIITSNLIRIADDGNLFAAEDAFKQLLITFNTKRIGTLCELARQANSPTPDLLVMKTLVQQLKDELKVISAAEDALGHYIKESNE